VILNDGILNSPPGGFRGALQNVAFSAFRIYLSLKARSAPHLAVRQTSSKPTVGTLILRPPSPGELSMYAVESVVLISTQRLKSPQVASYRFRKCRYPLLRVIIFDVSLKHLESCRVGLISMNPQRRTRECKELGHGSNVGTKVHHNSVAWSVGLEVIQASDEDLVQQEQWSSYFP